MPFIEGASFSGFWRELTLAVFGRSTGAKLGAGPSPYDANKGAIGDVNKGVSKVGAAPRRYAPELDRILGGDQW